MSDNDVDAQLRLLEEEQEILEEAQALADEVLGNLSSEIHARPKQNADFQPEFVPAVHEGPAKEVHQNAATKPALGRKKLTIARQAKISDNEDKTEAPAAKEQQNRQKEAPSAEIISIASKEQAEAADSAAEVLAANLTAEAGAAGKSFIKAVAGQDLARSGGELACLEGLKNVHNGGQHTGKGEVKKSINQPHKATSHPNAASAASKATKSVFNGDASTARKGTDPDVLKAIMSANKPEAKPLAAPKKRGRKPKADKENTPPDHIQAKAPVKKAKKNMLAKEKKPRGKSAYMFFADAHRPGLRESSPGMPMTEVMKKIAEMWKAISEADRRPFQVQAEEHAKQMGGIEGATPCPKTGFQVFCQEKLNTGIFSDATTMLDSIKKLWDDAEDDERAGYEKKAQGKRKLPAGPPRTKGKPKKAATQHPKDPPLPVEGPGQAAVANGQGESDDDSEREDCDWEAHPAEAILGVTLHNKLIVKRKGKDLTDYGLVDAPIVKRQRTDNTIKSPVTLQMLEEFESWEQGFQKAVRSHQEGGTLELGDIGKDSPLETCYYLGKMLERNYPLSKVDRKKDVASKFPVLGLSMVSQRLLDLEKARYKAAESRIADLEGLLKEAQQ